MKRTVLNTALCKTASNYSHFGVELQESKPLLFAGDTQSTQAAGGEVSANDGTASVVSDTLLKREPSNLFADSAPTLLGNQVSVGAEATAVVINTVPAITVPVSKCLDAEFIAKCISQGYTVDMLVETFIASVVTLYQQDCDPDVAKGMLAPIFISTICMMYAQYKLIIDGFIAARAGLSANNNVHKVLLLKNQLQALAGTLSAIIDGTRFFFNIMVVFNNTPTGLKYMVAGAAGAGKLGSFLMAKGHAACDIPFGKTLMGKIVYGILTAPVTPDFIKYVTAVMPLIGGAIYSSSIITLKETLDVENVALSSLLYTVAFFGGMMGFLIQKCYICDVMRKNIGRNVESVDSWNEFWYGGYNHCIMYNGDEAALLDKVSTLRPGIYKLGNEYFQITS